MPSGRTVESCTQSQSGSYLYLLRLPRGEAALKSRIEVKAQENLRSQDEQPGLAERCLQLPVDVHGTVAYRCPSLFGTAKREAVLTTCQQRKSGRVPGTITNVTRR